MIPNWPNVPVISFDEGFADEEALAFVERLEAALPPPEVPPPVWDRRPIDPDRCEEATKAMCG